jgi:glutamyl-tRNA reductase
LGLGVAKVNMLLMVGLSHRGSPIALLERVSVRRGEQASLLAALRAAGYAEAVVLSTCSRTEIYAIPALDSANDLLTILAEYAECPRALLESAAENRTGFAAVEHLFRVTGGLESRVVGEVEIYGQVRAALRAAATAGTAGASLRRLFAAALKAGDRVRDETTLGARGRSLAYQAVEIGLAAVGDVVDPVIVVVGAGRATAAVEHLGRLNQQPRVAARNEVSAARLAGADHVCPLPALATGMRQADLVICATSAAQHVVTLAEVRQAMSTRGARPLTVVDLSVPRNVEAAVDAVPGVRLIDLEGMNDDRSADPELAAALETGTTIVRSAVGRYAEDLAAADAGPIIAALRRHVEATCLRELTRTLSTRALAEQDLARAAHAIAGKLLYGPTIAARAAAATRDAGSLKRLCEIFGVRPTDLDLAAVHRQVPDEINNRVVARVQAGCG